MEEAMNIGNKYEQVGAYLQAILDKNFWTVADIHRATSLATDFEKIPTEKAMRNLLSGRTKRPTSKVLQAFAVGISKLSRESKWTADYILSEAAVAEQKLPSQYNNLPIGFPNFQTSFEKLGEIGRYILEDVNPWYSWTEHSASFISPNNCAYNFSEELIVKQIADSAAFLMISGESGTGKTRFMYELSKRLEYDGWLIVEMTPYASETDFAELVEIEKNSYEGIVILIDGMEQFALDRNRSELLKRIFRQVSDLNNAGCQFRVISTCRSAYIKSSFCDRVLLANYLVIDMSPDASSAEFNWLKQWRKIAKERIRKSERNDALENASVSISVLANISENRHEQKSLEEIRNWVEPRLVAVGSQGTAISQTLSERGTIDCLALLMNLPFPVDCLDKLDQRNSAIFENAMFNGLISEKGGDYHLGHDSICDGFLSYEVLHAGINTHRLLRSAKNIAAMLKRPTALAVSLFRNIDTFDPSMIIHENGRMTFPEGSNKNWFVLLQEFHSHLASLNPEESALASRVFELLRYSLSLNPKEKMRVLRACAVLSKFQLEELEKVFLAEANKFRILAATHPTDIAVLSYKDHQNEITAFQILETLYVDEALELVKFAQANDWKWPRFFREICCLVLSSMDPVDEKNAKSYLTDAIFITSSIEDLLVFATVMKAKFTDDIENEYIAAWIDYIETRSTKTFVQHFEFLLSRTPVLQTNFLRIAKIASSKNGILQSNLSIEPLVACLSEFASKFGAKAALNWANIQVEKMSCSGEIVSTYKKIHDEFPDDFHINLAFSIHASRFGKEQKTGICAAEKAIDLDPKNISGYMNHISVLNNFHSPKDTLIALVRKRLELFPNDLNLKRSLALQLSFNPLERSSPKELEEALSLFEEYLEAQPEDLWTLSTAAFASGLCNGHSPEVSTKFDRAIQQSFQDNSSPHIHLTYAQYLHAVAGDSVKAKVHIAIALSLCDELHTDDTLLLEAHFVSMLLDSRKTICPAMGTLLHRGVRSRTQPFHMNLERIRKDENPYFEYFLTLANIVNGICEPERLEELKW